MQRILAVLSIVLLSSILILGCDGGDEQFDVSGNRAFTPDDTVVLKGAVVTEAPLPAVVQAINTRGETSEGKVGADGRFSLVIARHPPYMLRTIPRDEGGELFSFATSEESVNLTPLTHLALYVAVGTEPTLNDLFHAWTGQLSAEEVQLAAAIVNANLAPLFTKSGLDYKTYNVFRTEFHADGMGMDALLDTIRIHIDPNAVTLSPSIHILDLSGNQLLTFDADATVDNPMTSPVATDQKKVGETR
jgi:hypothetical protein